jgi:TonB-dependent starch-binding outer membrane protein SusC
MTNPFIVYSPLVKAGLAIDPEGNGYANSVPATGASDLPTGARQIAVNMNAPPVKQMTVGLNLKF